MRILLDTASADEVRALAGWGCFAGVTTNPILLARAGASAEQAIPRLAEALPGELFAQARGRTAAELVADAERLARLAPGRMVIKIPIVEEGLRAIAQLAERRVATAATAVFRASQALLAARAGALYAIPFWHRMREDGTDPATEVARAANLFERLTASGIRARLLCASLRTPEDAMAALASGAHAVTVAPAVARALLEDAGTRAAVAQFERTAAAGTEE